MKSDAERIQFLGDRLYPKVLEFEKDLNVAGRITSMIIGISQHQMLELVSDDRKLMEYIDKAKETMNKPKQKRNSRNKDTATLAADVRKKVEQMKTQQQQELTQVMSNHSNNTGSSSGQKSSQQY